MTTEDDRFGGHSVTDNCLDLDFANPSMSERVRRKIERQQPFSKIPPYFYESIAKYGRRGFRISGIVEDAKAHLQNFVALGGSEKVPVTNFSAPEPFRINNFGIGTVVRLHRESDTFCDPEPEEYRYLSDLFHGHGTNLGVIWQAPNPENRLLVMIEEPFSRKPSEYSGRSAWVKFEEIKLGEWRHFVTVGSNSRGGYRIDLLESTYKVEILELGQEVKEKSTQPIKASLKPSFSPAP